MRTNIRFMAFVLAAAGALLVSSNAGAACPSIQFGQSVALLQTPSNNTASVRSNFWVLNGGNPAAGAGNDNGTTADNNAGTPWVKPYGSSLYVTGDWSQSTGYDGCPDPTPIPQQRMVFSFSDVSAGSTVFAVSCIQRQPLNGVQFDIDTSTGGGNLVLTAAPKAAITNTVRTGNEAQITVGSPNFAANFHSDGSTTCDLATVIPQFDVYQQQLARNAAAPSGRDAGAGAWVLVGTSNIGTPFQFTTACGTTNCDVYVAVAPHFNSGFTTGEAATGQAVRVGANSTKIQAGPTLAETPKFKVIKNGTPGGAKANQN